MVRNQARQPPFALCVAALIPRATPGHLPKKRQTVCNRTVGVRLRGPRANYFHAPVAQQNSAARFERDGRGCKSCREHHFPHVAQLEGGAPLRTETVRVQILSWGPFSPCSPTSRGAPLKTERLRVQIPPWGPLFAPVAQLAEAANLRSALCRCKSGLEHFWSMNRTSKPGLRAKEFGSFGGWGASPPCSALSPVV